MNEHCSFVELIETVFESENNVVNSEYVNTESARVEKFIGEAVQGCIATIV
jgi:hypothetical protein